MTEAPDRQTRDEQEGPSLKMRGVGKQKGTLAGVSREAAAWGVEPECARQGTGAGLSLGTRESYVLRFPKGLSFVVNLTGRMQTH